MKDKIFMTFLCVAVFGVTNAMGAVGDGPGSCKVQAEVEWSGSTTLHSWGDISVRVGGAYIYISDEEILQCGGDYCADGVEFKVSDQTSGFRCTVTDGTGEWKLVTSGGDIKFCDNSKIQDHGVENAEYPIVHKGQDGEIFEGNGYAIDTEGFCVDADCVDGYEYFNGKCVLAECKQLIDSGKAKEWDDENNACLCSDTANAEWKDNNCVCKDTVNAEMGDDGKCVCAEGMEFDEDGNCVKKVAESNDETGGQNEENPGKTACEGLISSGRATKWDDANNTCLCKDTANAEWKDNDCVCKDDGMEFDDDGNCVKKAAESNDGTGDQNKVSPDNSAKDSAKNDIETLGKWLDEETKKFERSKWRDAEGKFNTARLASDSIAGVVLGTAGGLISSKVIKKKQVENGFEDIKCTIGSQEVADWGDEFQVGIQ